MSDKRWVMFMMPVGPVVAWVDEEAMGGNDRIEAENLTRPVPGPNHQIGLEKIMDRAVLNLSAIPYWTPADNVMAATLSKLWDVPGQIVLPDNGKPRFKLS